MLSSQLDKHLAECDYRTVQCDHCHEKMIAKQLEVSGIVDRGPRKHDNFSLATCSLMYDVVL